MVVVFCLLIHAMMNHASRLEAPKVASNPITGPVQCVCIPVMVVSPSFASRALSRSNPHVTCLGVEKRSPLHIEKARRALERI